MKNVLAAPLFRQINEDEVQWARVIDARQAAEAAVYSASTTEGSQAAQEEASRAAKDEKKWAAKIYERLDYATEVQLGSVFEPQKFAPKNNWSSIVEGLKANSHPDCYGWTELTDLEFPGFCRRHMQNIAIIRKRATSGPTSP